MKNTFYFTLILLIGIFISACDLDEDHDHNGSETTEFNYRISINSPSVETKNLMDTIHLHVDFISDLSAPVHHVNIRIYSKSTGDEVYNAPGEAHVHEQSGTYSWHDDFGLTQENGIMQNTDYVLEAKVWGHTEGLEEVTESIEFNVAQ